MKKLIAKRRILYLGRMYEAGDTLPVNDADMARAWLRAGSAEWHGQEAAERRQTPPKTERDGQDTPEQAGGQNDTTTQENGENGGTTVLVDGHLDPEQLATMKKDAIEKLAAQLGVDISKAKNNQERATLIAAVTVQAPVEETGGAQ